MVVGTYDHALFDFPFDRRQPMGAADHPGYARDYLLRVAVMEVEDDRIGFAADFAGAFGQMLVEPRPPGFEGPFVSPALGSRVAVAPLVLVSDLAGSAPRL